MDYEKKALQYAEENGIIEYYVNGTFMEYWSFFGTSEGWVFVRYDLEAEKEVFRGAKIPMMGLPVPKFLLTQGGACRYNYMCG